MVDVNQKLMYKSLQKRVRHLHSVYVRNLSCLTSDVSSLQTYFSLHKSRKSPAFYKSEVVGATLNPSWESFDLTGLDLDPGCVCSNHVVIRVWSRVREQPTFVVQVLWDVDLRALVYHGDKVDDACAADVPNALVLGLWSGYFGAPAVGAGTAAALAPAAATAASSLAASAAAALPGVHPVTSAPATAGSSQPSDSLVRPWRLPTPDDVSTHKLSYSASLLTRLQTVLRALKQTRASVDRIRKSIHARLRSTEMHVSKSSEMEAVELRCRQLRLQVARERQYALERRRALLSLDLANEALANATGQKSEHVRSEAERVNALTTNLRSSRSRLHSTRSLVDARSRELAAELSYMYPIEKIAHDKFTIGGVCLPNSEDFQGHSDTDLSVGLGSVAHVVHTLSCFLDVPLQFPLACRSSRSFVADHIIDRPSLRDGEFPLFSKSKDKVAYRYAVFLLNKNVAQLRCALGMPTSDLRMTLPHLHSFLRAKLGVPTTWKESLTKPIAVLGAPRLNDAEVDGHGSGDDRSRTIAGGDSGSESSRAGVDANGSSHRSSPAAATAASAAAAASGLPSSYTTDDDDACSDIHANATAAPSRNLPVGADDEQDGVPHDDLTLAALANDQQQQQVDAQCGSVPPSAAAVASPAGEPLSVAGQRNVRRASSSHERSRQSSCRHAVLLLEDADDRASDDGAAEASDSTPIAASGLWLPTSNGDSGPVSTAGYSEAIS